MEIVTVAEMREIEREGFEAGTSYEAMVDMVGKAVAAEVDRYPRGLRITGLIGKGNNGADTIVALLELKKKGRATVLAAMWRFVRTSFRKKSQAPPSEDLS